MQRNTQFSDFLLDLLLEDNKHINTLEFIDKTNKAANFACVCVSLGIAQSFDTIKNCFKDTDTFFAKYFEIYSTAIENYNSIVGTNHRQLAIDEAKIFYPMDMFSSTLNKTVTDASNKQLLMQKLNSCKNSYIVIIRNEIAFIVIHYDNDDYIVMDPHVEYCGILSKEAVYKYITFNGVWDFLIAFLTPSYTDQLVQPAQQTQIENTNVDVPPAENPIFNIQPSEILTEPVSIVGERAEKAV